MLANNINAKPMNKTHLKYCHPINFKFAYDITFHYSFSDFVFESQKLLRFKQ